jgi:Family of unknown function (DUF5309)
MALPFEQVVGVQQDWANVVTNVQMVDTPFLGWLPVGKAPVQPERLYQADSFRTPATNSHPDGVPVDGAKSAGENRKQLRSVIQYLTKAANVTKLTQDYGNQAGVADELAREITNQTKELSKDIECAFLSAQECVVGATGTTGYKTRGVPNWIQRSAQATYPVDSTLYPAAAQVDTTATGSLTEDVVLNIMQGIGTTTRSTRPVTAFIAPNLQRAFNNFPMFVPSTASTINAGAYPSEIRGGVLDRGITRYITPFGPLDLVLSYNNYSLSNTGTYTTHSGFFLHQDMWEVAWGQGGMPKWVQKPYQGGQYEAFCEAIIMLTCWNPKGEGKYAPAT